MALLTAVPMAPDEPSISSMAGTRFSTKRTAPSAPSTPSAFAAFLISDAASRMRVMAVCDRHPKARARNRGANAQACFTAGFGRRVLRRRVGVSIGSSSAMISGLLRCTMSTRSRTVSTAPSRSHRISRPSPLISHASRSSVGAACSGGGPSPGGSRWGNRCSDAPEGWSRRHRRSVREGDRSRDRLFAVGGAQSARARPQQVLG